ncbi:MAG: sensor domain-containing diguanylate cyclase [Cellvibrionaceae bacterium]
MSSMGLKIYLAILLVGAASVAGASVPVDMSGKSEYLITSDNIEYLKTGFEVDWEDIASKEFKGEWKSPARPSLNLWSEEKVVWVRIPIINDQPDPKKYIAEIRWPLLKDVKARSYSHDVYGDMFIGGLDYIREEKNIDDKNLSIPIEMEGYSQTTLYIKIIDENLVFIPIIFWEEKTYEKYSDRRLIGFSVAFGILIIMTLYNFFLSVFTRDKMYIFYSLTVLSTLLYSLSATGYGAQYLWGGNQWMLTNIYHVFTPLAFMTITYFFRVFLRMDDYSDFLARSNNYFVGLWAGILIISLTPLKKFSVLSIAPLGVLLIVAGLCIAIYFWWRGNPTAKYFVISWSGIFIATFLNIFILLGVIKYFPAQEYIQTLSFVFEVVLLSIALAERISREREEKEFAQAEVIDQKSSILIMQEKANVELEKNVRARTLELAKALTDLERANEELARVSTIDPLTQLYNRGFFDEAAKAEISRSSRTSSSMSMILIDIDHFKEVNDNYGHVVGDKCLKLVAQCIMKVVSRASDVVARYGGEEFAVILPDTIEKNAIVVAERIRKAISEIAFINEGKAIKLTASFGVVGRTIVKGDTVESFVNSADTALYIAKDNGRDRVEASVLAVKRQ